MCLILFAYRAHPRYRLMLAANRDEQYARPSAAAAFWEDAPQICGGRDLEFGGTWLGIARDGRFSAVTNYREGYPARSAPRSRGTLVSDFLLGSGTAAAYARTIDRTKLEYSGFNLLVADAAAMHYLSNRADGPQEVPPGVHGLSNRLLNEPWPKVERGRRAVDGLLSENDETRIVDALFATLADRAGAPDSALPDTGVGIARERILAPAFIVNESYGTRSSTVLLVTNNGEVTLMERTFGVEGSAGGNVTHRFVIDTVSGGVANAV